MSAALVILFLGVFVILEHELIFDEVEGVGCGGVNCYNLSREGIF